MLNSSNKFKSFDFGFENKPVSYSKGLGDNATFLGGILDTKILTGKDSAIPNPLDTLLDFSIRCSCES